MYLVISPKFLLTGSARRGREGRLVEGRRCGTEYAIGVGLILSMLRAVWDDSCQADLEVFSVRVLPRGVSD